MSRFPAIVAIATVMLLGPLPALAEDGRPSGDAAHIGEPKAVRAVDVVEKLHEPIPLNLTFTDQDARPFQLSQAFTNGKPVILTLVYYRCQALCDLVVSGLVRGLEGTGMQLGRDYQAITASIDPTETSQEARKAKHGHLQSMGAKSDDPSWTFLTGNEANIHALADAAGFKYSYDAETKQYAHAAVVFLLTPDGRMSRYLYGIDFNPRDLKLGLLEAGQGRVGTTLDRIVLKCFKYDPASRRYTMYMFGFLRGGALLVFFALATLLWKLWRREFKNRHAAGGHAG